MKCLSCGAENEACNRTCYQCKALLKRVKLDAVTKGLMIISMLIAGSIGSSQVVSLIVLFGEMAVTTRVIFGLFAVFTTLIVVSSVLFLIKKKRIYIIFDGLGWVAFSVCVYCAGGSPIFAVILMVPYIYTVFRVIPNWKQL